jgi:hypothetical protein
MFLFKTFARSATFAHIVRVTEDYKSIKNNVHGRCLPGVFMEKLRRIK